MFVTTYYKLNIIYNETTGCISIYSISFYFDTLL